MGKLHGVKIKLSMIHVEKKYVKINILLVISIGRKYDYEEK